MPCIWRFSQAGTLTFYGCAKFAIDFFPRLVFKKGLCRNGYRPFGICNMNEIVGECMIAIPIQSIRLMRTAALIVFLAAIGPSVWAGEKKQPVEGTGCFSFGDNDTPASAKDSAFLLAKRNAVESYKSHVISKSVVRNFELEQDLAETIAEGFLYDTKILETTEKNREICVKILAYVKPAEIDRLLSERMKTVAETERTALEGEWDPYEKTPSKSAIERKDGAVVWTYGIPKITDETYAGLNLWLDSVSVKNRKLGVRLDSKAGKPLHVIFFSFAPGYSKDDDDETYVPAECEVQLKLGKQVISIDPGTCRIPSWWREEKSAPADIAFNPEDVRYIDFNAVVDSDLGPVSDTVKIEAVFLD